MPVGDRLHDHQLEELCCICQVHPGSSFTTICLPVSEGGYPNWEGSLGRAGEGDDGENLYST